MLRVVTNVDWLSLSFFAVVWILCCCLVSWLQVCCAHASLTHLSCKTPLLISSITLWWKGDHSNNWQALARLSDIKAEEIELACLLWQAMGQATYDYFLLLHGKALSISHVLHEWFYKPFWLVQILQRHAISCSMKIFCLKCKTHQELANKRLALDVAALADLCHLPELLHRLQLPRWEGTHSVVPVSCTISPHSGACLAHTPPVSFCQVNLNSMALHHPLSAAPILLHKGGFFL